MRRASNCCGIWLWRVAAGSERAEQSFEACKKTSTQTGDTHTTPVDNQANRKQCAKKGNGAERLSPLLGANLRVDGDGQEGHGGQAKGNLHGDWVGGLQNKSVWKLTPTTIVRNVTVSRAAATTLPAVRARTENTGFVRTNEWYQKKSMAECQTVYARAVLN